MLDRAADWDPPRCARDAIQRTLIPNPTARIMATQVPDFPGPQVILQTARSVHTRRAVVVECDACSPCYSVCEYPFGQSVRSFIFGLTIERHPWTDSIYEMTSYTCTVDRRPFPCTQTLPPDADVVSIYAAYPTANSDVELLQDTVPISGLPEPSPAEHRPHLHGNARPPVPPVPSLGRRWGVSTVFGITSNAPTPASCSVPGTVCLITLLSNRQTSRSNASTTVGVLDSLSVVRDRPGFNAHYCSNNTRTPPKTRGITEVPDAPHVLVRKASQHLLPYHPHTTVQACWPIEQPRSHMHLLHLLLEFDRPRTEETTMVLIDCRGVAAIEGDYVVFSEKRDLTAGELFAILRDKVSCQQPPAAILVNGRPLDSLAVRRYSSPLVRLLSREQCDARDYDPEAFCPASWSTHFVLGFVPGFSALTDTYEAFLRRQYGMHSRHRRTTTTSTTAAPSQEAFLPGRTTTTTSEPPGSRDANSHPLGPLESLPICVHLSSADGDVFTMTVNGVSCAEQLLFQLCRSMHKHQKFQARDEVAVYNQVLATSKEVRLFLHVRRQRAADRVWVFAPQWLDSPLLISCREYNRADFFARIGIPDRPHHVISVRGVVCRRAVHACHGDVVVVETFSFFVHRAPMMTLMPRIPDIQALLFRHLGPSQEALDDPQLHLAFWQSAVRHCQNLFGLDEGGALTTLVSADIPSAVVCLGTRTYPTTAQVQQFYDERLAGKFGRRHSCDTAYMD